MSDPSLDGALENDDKNGSIEMHGGHTEVGLPDLLERAQKWAETELPFVIPQSSMAMHVESERKEREATREVEITEQEESKSKDRVEHSVSSQAHGLEQLSFVPATELLVAVGNDPFFLTPRDFISSDVLAADLGNSNFCVFEDDTVSGGISEPPAKAHYGPHPRLSADDRWEVIFWDSSLRGMDKLGPMFRRKVAVIVHELAHGRFPPTPAMLLQKSRCLNPEIKNFLFQTPLKGDFSDKWHLIWQVDWDYSPRKRCICEVLRIWDVVPTSELRAVGLTIISRWLASAERYAAFLCQAVIEASDHSELYPRVVKKQLNPQTFVWEDEASSQPVKSVKSVSEKSSATAAEAALPLDAYILDKFVSSSSTLLQEIVDGNASQQFRLFRLSPREHQLLKAPQGQSVLVSGRSGTGKTTCGLLRLATMAASFNKMFRAGEKPEGDTKAEGPVKDDNGQQAFLSMFVAVSPRLCHEAKQFYTKVCESNAELKGDLSEDVLPKFLTLSQLLLFIDKSLSRPFFAPQTSKPQDETSGIEAEDSDEEEEAADNEVPLDDICRTAMTTRWLPPSVDDVFQTREVSGDTLLSSFLAGKRQARTTGGHVNYDYFVFQLFGQLRPQVPVEMRKDLPHPGVVWRHIQSFIKGSLLSLETGRLSLEQYMSLGVKRGRLDVKAKQAIYQMFLAYEGYKAMNHLFDLQDFVRHVFRHLSSELGGGRYTGPRVNFLVVDEAQDLTQAQIAIVLLICGGHVFLCADSCQTIAQDVDFRFCDVRSLIFHQQRGEMGLVPPQNMKRISKPPLPMQLIHNFRTHAAILALSSVCVDLLEQLFPQSIDVMERDQGACQGPKPLLLTLAAGSIEVLFEGGAEGTTEFGARQAVIVRTERAKRTLPKSFQGGLVLTPEQAKGLEFDTVILYNMFADSLCSEDDWRAIVSHLKLDPAAMKKLRRVAFDPLRHDSLCAELKILYVALTRARKRLVIIDDAWSTNSMIQGWIALGLVKVSRDAADFLHALTGGQSQDKGTEEWNQLGEKFMEDGKYEIAAQCFGKAKKHQLRDRCAAYALAVDAAHYLAQAEEVDETGNDPRTGKKQSATITRRQLRASAYADYKKAANLLLQLGRFAEACGCFWSAKDYNAVAHIGALTQEWNLSSRAWDACSRPLYSASALTNAKYHLAAADLISKFATDQLMAYILFYRATILSLHGRRIAPKLDRYLFKAGAYYAARKNWEMVRECISNFSDPNVLGAAFLVEHRLWDLLDEYARGGDGVIRMGRLLEQEGKFMEAAMCFFRTDQRASVLACVLRAQKNLEYKVPTGTLLGRHSIGFMEGPALNYSSAEYTLRLNVHDLLDFALKGEVSTFNEARGVLIWFITRNNDRGLEVYRTPDLLDKAFSKPTELLTMAVEVFRSVRDVAYEMRGLELLWSWLQLHIQELRKVLRLPTHVALEIELSSRLLSVEERLCALYSGVIDQFWPRDSISLDQWRDHKTIHSCDQFPSDALAHFGLEPSESRFTRVIPLRKKRRQADPSKEKKQTPVDDPAYEGDIFVFPIANMAVAQVLIRNEQPFFKRVFQEQKDAREKKVHTVTRLRALWRALIAEYLRRLFQVHQSILTQTVPATEIEHPWSWGKECGLTRQLYTHAYLSRAIAKFYVLLDEDQRVLAQRTNGELFQSALRILSEKVMHFSPYKTKPVKTTTELPLTASARRHLVTVVDSVWQNALVNQRGATYSFVWELFVVLASIGRTQRWQEFMTMRAFGINSATPLINILSADTTLRAQQLQANLLPQLQMHAKLPTDLVFIIAEYAIPALSPLPEFESLLGKVAMEHTPSTSSVHLATWLCWSCHEDTILAQRCFVHLKHLVTSAWARGDIAWASVENGAYCLQAMNDQYTPPVTYTMPGTFRHRAPSGWTAQPPASWGPASIKELCGRRRINDCQNEDPPTEFVFARFLGHSK